jgi:hypothetical protein
MVVRLIRKNRGSELRTCFHQLVDLSSFTIALHCCMHDISVNAEKVQSERSHSRFFTHES